MISVAIFARRKARNLQNGGRGLDFSAVIQLERLGLNGNTVYRGSRSGNKYPHAVIDDRRCTPESILDIGCAKSGVLACMSKFPFASLVVMEISTKLTSICMQNLLRWDRPQIGVQ